MRYSFDTSAFINPWKHYYRPRSFPRIWETLDSLIQIQEIVSTEMVFHELSKQKDELYQWVLQRKEHLIVYVDEEQQEIQSEIINRFPELVNPILGTTFYRENRCT